MGGDRCASTACWQPTLGLPVEALAVAEELPFDAGALITTRAAVRHLARGATRPLRRGRTSCMPTALLCSSHGEIWPEPSSQPSQGLEGRGMGSEGRTFRQTKSTVGFGGKQRLASIDLRARPKKQPRGVKGLHSHSTANTKYHSSAPAPRPQRHKTP